MESKTPLTDSFLESIKGITVAAPQDYFYNRLIERLESEQSQSTWAFPLKPIWMISTLTIFLAINTFIILKENKSAKITETASIESFASAYDQNILSY